MINGQKFDDWEFNVLGIYNYRKPGKLEAYYSFIKENHDALDGDIVEAGVFNGKSLLSTALLLKRLGSKKKVYGFDSFSGFPPVYHEKDSLVRFRDLVENEVISEAHYTAHKKLKNHRKFLKKEKITVKNISSSDNFSKANLSLLKEKIEHLQLNNIVLVQGSFEKTMTDAQIQPQKIMAALLDCDLYNSYWQSLPFIWERLNKGGFVYLDEYYSLKFPGARIACNEYFEDKKDKPQLFSNKSGDFERWYVQKTI